MSDPLLWVVVASALAAACVNGFHDTSAQVGTLISTRALAPRTAVLVAAVANTLGALVGTAVATTIGTRLLNGHVPLRVLLAALLGAILWNLLLWRLGRPSSSTHALVGGLLGAALACGGGLGVDWGGVARYAILPAVVAPLLAFLVAIGFVVVLLWGLRAVRPAPANRALRTLQIATGGGAALFHGMNDAQKATGVIGLALYSAHHSQSFSVPGWARITAALAIGIGTYAGGWRFMRTIATRIAQLEPAGAVAAETASVVSLAVSASTGLLAAPTQVVGVALVGAGAVVRFSPTRWGITRHTALAWLLTPFAAAGLAAIAYAVLGAYT